MSKEIKREYPYTAWVLLPSFKPVQVTLVEKNPYSFGDWDRTETGKAYYTKDLHTTKAEAITDGQRQIAKAESDLTKRRANLDKKIVALMKASKEN